jgi:hypothetical protein
MGSFELGHLRADWARAGVAAAGKVKPDERKNGHHTDFSVNCFRLRKYRFQLPLRKVCANFMHPMNENCPYRMTVNENSKEVLGDAQTVFATLSSNELDQLFLNHVAAVASLSVGGTKLVKSGQKVFVEPSVNGDLALHLGRAVRGGLLGGSHKSCADFAQTLSKPQTKNHASR